MLYQNKIQAGQLSPQLNKLTSPKDAVPATRAFHAAQLKADNVMGLGAKVVMAMNDFAKKIEDFRVVRCDTLTYGAVASSIRVMGEQIELMQTGEIKERSAASLTAELKESSREPLEKIRAAMAALRKAEAAEIERFFFVSHEQPLILPEVRIHLSEDNASFERQKVRERATRRTVETAPPKFVVPLGNAIKNILDLDSKFPPDGTHEPHVRACFTALLSCMKAAFTEMQQMRMWDGLPDSIALLRSTVKLHSSELCIGALLFNELLDPPGVPSDKQRQVIARSIFRSRSAEPEITSTNGINSRALLGEPMTRELLSFIEAAGRLAEVRERVACNDESAFLNEWLAFRGEFNRLSEAIAQYPSNACVDRAGQLKRDGIISDAQEKIVFEELGLLPLPPLPESVREMLGSDAVIAEKSAEADEKALFLEVLSHHGITHEGVASAVKNGSLTVSQYDHRRMQLSAALLGDYVAADLVIAQSPGHLISPVAQFDSYLKRLASVTTAIHSENPSASVSELQKYAATLATEDGLSRESRLHEVLAKTLKCVNSAQAVVGNNSALLSLDLPAFNSYVEALERTVTAIRTFNVEQLPEYQPLISPENFSSVEVLNRTLARITIESELTRDGFVPEITLPILRAVRDSGGLTRGALNLPRFAEVWGKRQLEGELRLLVARGALSLSSSGIALVPSSKIQPPARSSIVNALRLIEQEAKGEIDPGYSVSLDFLMQEMRSFRPAATARPMQRRVSR